MANERLGSMVLEVTCIPNADLVHGHELLLDQIRAVPSLSHCSLFIQNHRFNRYSAKLLCIYF